MKKELRDKIYNKYNGRCAYTGKKLSDDWQVDHILSKFKHSYHKLDTDVNHISNLIPAERIINHYKRAYDLEGFREYMLTFHIRLAKLPKNTKVEATKKTILYMNTIADLFDIKLDKPFNGIFFFEKL